jgi:hypothetical protein
MVARPASRGSRYQAARTAAVAPLFVVETVGEGGWLATGLASAITAEPANESAPLGRQNR